MPQGGLGSEEIHFPVMPSNAGRNRQFLAALAGFSVDMSKRTVIEDALRHLAPKMPAHEFGAVVDHALDSRGLRSATPETAAWLSLVAYVRHALTEYDDLLTQGYDQDSARFFVAAEIERVLAEWGARRKLGADER
jgi:hypothetical protein